MSKTVGRRAVVRGAAWAVPTAAVAVAAPAFADWTDCTDIAVDGWTYSKNTSVGTVSYPMFRVIIGTMTNYTNVQATLTIQSANFSFTGSVTGVSPAGAVSPCTYRTNVISPVPSPVITNSAQEIDWAVGAMPAKSSVMYTVQGDPVDPTSTGPYVVTLTVTADYKCSELYTGTCPTDRPTSTNPCPTA